MDVQTVNVEVEAYAGAAYPERPLRVRWHGRWRGVLALESEHREPGRRCFAVLVEGARRDIRLRLCYDYANDAWQAERLGGGF
ncbi:MAG TPA: hypothetical protein VFT91_01910 [Dehalococcoidia bacterium]|nr:hypothetical protein [Dehalococcoidia bacterium]